MSARPWTAALLALAFASGCSSVSENTVSLVAHKPLLSRWPWKRTPPPAARITRPDSLAEEPRQADPAGPGSSSPSHESFLQTLPPDLRNRIEADLADADPEERHRLVRYFATVEPDRIPALLDARKERRAPAPQPETMPVVTAAAAGRPTFELDDDAAADPQVDQASADLPPVVSTAPIPRPRRNPLIEIQGVEFEEEMAAPPDEVVPAGEMSLESQSEPGLPSEGPSPESPSSNFDGPAASSASLANPLTKLKEWTTIRKPDPLSASATTPDPALADASALSLQGLSRRFRGAPRTETASLSADAPFDSVESPHLHENIQRLIALMEAETARLKPGTSFAEREEYVRRHAELRMLHLMSGQPTLALQAIPGADEETQEFWTSLMWAMSDYFDNEAIVDPSERAAAALDRLRAAGHFLQSTAKLDLRSLAFCDKIDGFGAYHPFEQNVFRPGQPVLLYAEIRNFKTEVTSAGRYRTVLRSSIEIVKSGDDGNVIERRHFDSTEDQSRSPRTDYFHSYKLDLPLHLTPGSYTLRLTLEDELSGKIGNSSIEFLVR